MNKYIILYGNLYDCPAGPRLESCPLTCMQHLTFEEKYDVVSRLSNEEQDAILKHHDDCLLKRKS